MMPLASRVIGKRFFCWHAKWLEFNTPPPTAPATHFQSIHHESFGTSEALLLFVCHIAVKENAWAGVQTPANLLQSSAPLLHRFSDFYNINAVTLYFWLIPHCCLGDVFHLLLCKWICNISRFIFFKKTTTTFFIICLIISFRIWLLGLHLNNKSPSWSIISL